MSISTRIRKQLEQPNGLTPELLEPLAIEYSRLVTEANQRLEECVALLRRGLRSEALQRATIKPNVLDLISELDFPELTDWVEILQFYGIQLPENIDRDAIAQLNEAFVDEQPLEELLRQHRRLALAKAPLSWRLRVLQKIASIDFLNPVWMDDLREWEIARLKQISSEWNALDKSQTPLQDLVKLRDELEPSNWTQKPAAELVSEIKRVVRQRVYESKVSELRQLANDIHLAYSAGDESTLGSKAKSWTSLIGEMTPPPPKDLLEEVAPALEWLDGRNQENQQVAKHALLSSQLEAILQRPQVSEGELQRAYHDVASLQLGIEPLLETRFETRLREIQQASKRKQFIYLTGIVSTTLLMMVAAGLWYWNHNFRQAISSTSEKLTQLIDSEKYSEAKSIFDTIQSQAPSVANSPEITAIKASLDSRLDAEKQRSEEVLQAISAVDNEQSAELDISKIVAVEKIAKTMEEKSRIASIRSRYDQYQRKLEDEDLKLLRSELLKIESDMEHIQKSPLASIDEAEMDGIILTLKGLLNRFPKANVAGTKAVDLATKRAVSIRDSVLKQRRDIAQKQSLMSGIREASSVKDYEIQLRKFVDTMPADTMSLEFQESLKEKDLWRAIEDWNVWCSDAMLQLAGKLDPTKTATMLARCEQATTRLDGLPGREIVALYIERFKLAAKRDGLLEGLVKNLEESAIMEILTVESSFGRRSFIRHDAIDELEEIVAKSTPRSSTTVPVLSDANGGVSNRELKGKLTIGTEPRQAIRTMIRNLKNSKNSIIGNWEAEWIRIINELAAQPAVDGRIKELLLARLSGTAQEGSATMMKAFTNLQTELFNTSEVRNRWYTESNVNDKLSESLSIKFEEAKRELEKKLKDESNALRVIARLKAVWVGGLLRDRNGEIFPNLYRRDIPDGTLVVVAQQESNASRGRLVQVGNVKNQVVDLQGNTKELVPGRPLFWIRSTPNTP
jgi:hypothetical protein